MFKPSTLYYSDGYKPGHKAMLAPGTDYLYGSWIPRSLKHGPKGAVRVVSFGQQFAMRWLHDEFAENFFKLDYTKAIQFGKDMSLYLGLEYDAVHFNKLWELNYLPIRVKSLPEGIETQVNVPHMTFINTVPGYAWLTLYLETIISALSWKSATSATIALQYKRNLTKWVEKTDPDNAFLIPYLCHDFSARGMDPFSMLASGLGHATSFRGSDTLIVIPGSRYYYGEPENEVCINSVNASEHSVSTTKIFTVGERQMILDWLKICPKGIFSMVADTFSLWEFINYLRDPEIKAAVLARDGKLVVRPDSGDPVDIICGTYQKIKGSGDYKSDYTESPEAKGVIELLWDIYGGTVNKQGYKVLDPHIGAIYGDSINIERQLQIYERLEKKGFAATNIVLGVGSFTYQYNTRDTLGFAAKGCWFEAHGDGYDIYKDPVTDDGTKKSLKGLLRVEESESGMTVWQQCTKDEEASGMLKTIYEDGKFYGQTTLTKIREKLNAAV